MLKRSTRKKLLQLWKSANSRTSEEHLARLHITLNLNLD